MSEESSADYDAGLIARLDRQYAELVASGAIIRCRRKRPFGAETPCTCADECGMDQPFALDPLPSATGDSGRVTGVELHCDDCQQPYGVWFAENDVWNLVMGGPEAKGDPGGMLCPRCFTVRAESVFQQTAIWRLVLDNAARIPSPAKSGAGEYDPWLMQDYERDAETWDGDTRVTPPGSGRTEEPTP